MTSTAMSWRCSRASSPIWTRRPRDCWLLLFCFTLPWNNLVKNASIEALPQGASECWKSAESGESSRRTHQCRPPASLSPRERRRRSFVTASAGHQPPTLFDGRQDQAKREGEVFSRPIPPQLEVVPLSRQ